MISTILINRNVHVLCYFPGVPLLSFSSFDTEGLRSASSLNGPRRVSRHFTCRGMLQNDHDLIVERDMPIVAYTSSLAILSRTSISLHCCFSCAPIASYAPRPDENVREQGCPSMLFTPLAGMAHSKSVEKGKARQLTWS